MHVNPPPGWTPPPPWVRLPPETRLEVELHREMCDAHPLRFLDPKSVARRQDCDDVLFTLSDGRLAIVHLTWRRETNPNWPAYTIVSDWSEISEDSSG